MTPFLQKHAEILLNSFLSSNKPLDLSLSHYFRSNKNLGASDRREIGETLYGILRWKSLIDHFAPLDPIAFYRAIDWDRILKDKAVPPAAKLGLPEFLYTRFKTHFGEEKTEELGRILNEQAPTTLRVNLLKISREELLQKLAQKFSCSPCSLSKAGIQVHKREPLFALPEFKEGLFEIQDEGSQLISQLMEAKPGDCVLDYCSGSGGKTLGFAPSMQGKGQIYLHDIRPSALLEARKRLKRAGVQNAQCLLPDHVQLKKLIGKCDWVLIDVPCSGTGTLRRNPDQKWKIDAPLIEKFILEQREIAKKVIPYLKGSGRLVYATCSLLPEENQSQVDYFLQHLPLRLDKEPLLLPPVSRGMDGFFCAVFKKQTF